LTIAERYRSPASLPQLLPVFPLRGVLLLPGTTMPLHVFEPRYLELLNDVISGERVIGIIQPERSEEAVESPAGRDVKLRKVGCVGRVTAFQELDDGRLYITISGIARFTVEGEVDNGKAYRTCRVRYTDFPMDFGTDTTAEQIERDSLFRVLKSFFDFHHMSVDWNSIGNAQSEQVVNVLAVVAPFGPEEKQALLEAASLKARADVLEALAEMAVASGSGSDGSTLQ
jgi:Lon protease-like protein